MNRPVAEGLTMALCSVGLGLGLCTVTPDPSEDPFSLSPQTSGVPIRACKRAQLNIIVKRVKGFP